MARLLIADVTLLKEAEVWAQVRFHGGATHTLHLPLPKPAWLLRQTPAMVVAEIDRLLEDHTDGEIAALLNGQGLLSGESKPFHRLMVRHIRIDYALPSRHDRLLTRGLLTLHQMAQCLNVCSETLKYWRRAGLLKAHKYDDRGGYLFEPPGPGTPIKHQHQGKTTGQSTTREGSFPAHTA